MMKKLAIIGRGTAGCLAVTHYLKYTNWDIEWYFDDNIKPQSVGEGSDFVLPRELRQNIGFLYNDLDKFDGSIKLGIHKENWGTGTTFLHSFDPPSIALHFSAVKMQDYIISKVRDNPRLTIHNKNITYDELDCDFIMDCSGAPSSYEDFNTVADVPVNAAYVVQCPWERARFNHTLTLARPYGWVFGIPLADRCSFGYLYNKDITSNSDVVDDLLNNVIPQYDVVPGDTNNTTFGNYYRKKNFDGRVCYNGNASFFLEPLEATSISTMNFINRLAYDNWMGEGRAQQEINNEYSAYVNCTLDIIMMHYAAGSTFDDEFWKIARERGAKYLKRIVTNPLINKRLLGDNSIEVHHGPWGENSFDQNIRGLGLDKKFKSMARYWRQQ